jgi:hypothetical protein
MLRRGERPDRCSVHRSEHRWRGFLFSIYNQLIASMKQPSIRVLAVTRQAGFDGLADSWRAPVMGVGSVSPRRIEDMTSTLESQRITTQAGGWGGAGASAR